MISIVILSFTFFAKFLLLNAEPPKVQPMLTVPHLKEGMKFGALCTISQGTEPLRFQWFKNGFPISNHILNLKIETSSIVSNLIFEKITRADSANYTCVVSNSFGEDSKSFTLGVKVSLKWIEEPQDSTVTEGRDFIINCKAEGIPPPQIKWKKGQNEVQRSKETLEFKSITLDDSGEYECIVENGVDNSLSKKFKISVIAIVKCDYVYLIDPPRIQPIPPFPPLSEGMQVTIVCSVFQGTEPLEFNWYKDGNSLNKRLSNGKIDINSRVSTLSFDKITRSDSGNYTCVVKNVYGENKNSFVLTVNVAMKWIEKPKDTTIILGHNHIITCIADGFPRPQISWRKNKNVILSHSERFEIKNADYKDKGEYECKAENGVDQILSKTFKITIVETPKIQPISPFPPFSEGLKVRAVCSVLHGTEPFEFNWFKHETSINEHLSNIKIETNSGVSTLIFEKVSRNDSGNYTCVVNNAYGEDKTSFVLTIKVAMKWIEEPKDMTIVEGNGIIINCIAEGFPRPQISWWKNKNVILSHSERFEIKNAAYKDRGEYECKAENGVDQILSKTFKITVVGKEKKSALL
ncbi:Down syndrome cell adhesion molecule-like protein Dscam2 [Dinothrombium tinctorium]|uniref:Down syndrome cell adhesion molecule-like protein Dscam2 n=1 Tax=Dinothrombium tinctorium TaxID=1965070 RepID=A0A3S3NME5_9ACAR|nr:Down syndrome cell adhesion molecule-like protein Dscam2 [Dinothrombium tinctorium]